MPPRLDRSFLEQHCVAPPSGSHADRWRLQRVAAALGPLQSRWLSDEAITALGHPASGAGSLPETAQPGYFDVLVAARGSFALLRPAFLMPLRWVGGRPHSRRLPPTLCDHADKMIAIHSKISGLPESGRWGLDAAFAGDEAEAWATTDLSGLDIESGSASAAMLAALLSAEFAGFGNGRVLASVACDADSISKVDSIAVKLDAAVRADALRVFLCEENRPEGDAWVRATGRTDLIEYLPLARSLQERLSPFMRARWAPPAADAPIEQHRRYLEEALSGPRQGAKRRAYYLAYLAQRLALQHIARHPDGPRPGQRCLLAGVVSPDQTPTLAFLAHVYAPEAVLLVYDPARAAEDAAALKRHLEEVAGVRRVESITESLESMEIEKLEQLLRAQFHRFCGRLQGDADGTDLVCDLTAGLKRLTFAMLNAVPPGTQLVHVDSKRVHNSHQIGTERIWIIG